MRKNSDNKSSSVIWAVVFIIFFLMLLAAILYPVFNEQAADALTGGILLLYGAVILASIIGIIFALRQRLKEIKDGELDEAKKY